jgi:hypothetical protein
MRWLSWLRRRQRLRLQRLRWLQRLRRLQSLPLRRRMRRLWRWLDRGWRASGMHGVLRIMGPLPLVLGAGAP